MDETNPTETMLAAFYDLFKRVVLFFFCFVIGIIQGVIANYWNNFLSVGKAEDVSALSTADWYDEPLINNLSVPQLPYILMGLGGCLATCIGMVRLVRGSNTKDTVVLIVIGGCLFAILGTHSLGWTVNTATWIGVGIFLVLDFALAMMWQQRQHNRWVNELEAIREENQKRREGQRAKYTPPSE